jgi:hypothetical protein
VSGIAAATAKMNAAIDNLLGDGGEFTRVLSGLFEQIEQAENEIQRAIRRHPESADLLYHSFRLLTPGHELMRTEFVYRSHCAELLERVVAGQDTRPGTAAEICIACCEASQLAPLTSTAAGLYARMWGQAFPGHGQQWDTAAGHYEALSGPQIDDLEAWARRKLAIGDRRITKIDCGGRHHGQPVNCTARVPGKRAAVAVVAGPEPDESGQLDLFTILTDAAA